MTFDVEREILLRTLASCNNNKRQAAACSRITAKTVYNRLLRYRSLGWADDNVVGASPDGDAESWSLSRKAIDESSTAPMVGLPARAGRGCRCRIAARVHFDVVVVRYEIVDQAERMNRRAGVHRVGDLLGCGRQYSIGSSTAFRMRSSRSGVGEIKAESGRSTRCSPACGTRRGGGERLLKAPEGFRRVITFRANDAALDEDRIVDGPGITRRRA